MAALAEAADEVVHALADVELLEHASRSLARS
jgi:hypothetical protein